MELRKVNIRGMVYLTSLGFTVNPGETVKVQWSGCVRVVFRSNDDVINNTLYRSYVDRHVSSEIMHYLSHFFCRVKMHRLPWLPNGGVFDAAAG